MTNNSFDSISPFNVPSGDKIPFPIKKARQINRTGVRNFPIISITFVGRIVNMSVKVKKIIEKITEFILGINGVILNSNVVAAVLGIATIGPKQSIIINSKLSPNVLPARPIMA